MKNIDMSINRSNMITTLTGVEEDLRVLIFAHGGSGDKRLDDILLDIASRCHNAIDDISRVNSTIAD